MNDVLLEIAKQSALVAVLTYIIYWLKNKNEKQEEEIKELNKELRQEQASNIKAFGDITIIMKDISTEQLTSNKDILNKLNNIHEWLKDKIKQD